MPSDVATGSTLRIRIIKVTREGHRCYKNNCRWVQADFRKPGLRNIHRGLSAASSTYWPLRVSREWSHNINWILHAQYAMFRYSITVKPRRRSGIWNSSDGSSVSTTVLRIVCGWNRLIHGSQVQGRARAKRAAGLGATKNRQLHHKRERFVSIDGKEML